ncbi:beta strand repeat-containing protein [Enterococcus sp. LJL90]
MNKYYFRGSFILVIIFMLILGFAQLQFGMTATSAAEDSNGDYSNELTYSQWGGTDNTWGDEPANDSNIIHVYTYAQLTKALRGTFTSSDGNDAADGIAYANKNSFSYIKLMNNIDNSNYTSALGTAVDISLAQQRSVVIDGNGFFLSTGQYYYRWGAGGNNGSAYAISVYIKNLDMYSQNPYGCFSNWFNRYSSFVYDGVSYTGSQLSASYLSTQVFRNTNTIKNVNSFTHPTTGNIVNCYNSNVSSGLEGRRVYVQSGSNTTFNTVTGDGVILGAYMSESVTTNAPILHIESNATLNVTASGNGGESYTYNSTNGGVYAGVNIQNGGSLTLGTGATMNVDVSGTGRAGVRLTGGNSNKITTVDLLDNAKLNVVTDGPMGMNQSGIFGVDDTTYSYYAGLSLYNYSKINLAGSGAELNVSMSNANYYRSSSLGFSPGIYMGTNSNVYVASEASMNLTMDGSFGSALKMVGTNSEFLVEDNGSVNFDFLNQSGTAYTGTSTSSASLTATNNYQATSDMVYVNAGAFSIGELGTFTIKVSDGTGTRNMLYAGNGSFSFSDVEKVDLDAQGNNNVQLVNMAGNFAADIQGIYAWNKNNSVTTTEGADFTWIPIYNATIPYTRSSSGTVTVGSVTASSTNTTTSSSFTSNYDTTKFNRVLFEHIPDVEVSIDEVSDNVTQTNGTQISGITNPNAYVLISVNGTTLGTTLDTGSLNMAGTEVYYNVQADASGNYSLSIPTTSTLYVGDTVTAYSFLNGKENTTTTTVVDETPPEVTTKTYYAYVGDTAPAASAFVSTITDKGVTDTSSYPVSYADSTDMATLMQTAGTKQVSLTVSDLAVDSAGLSAPNTTTTTAELIVYDSSTNLSGDSVELSYADIRNMTDSELSTYILSKCNPTAYSVSGGEKTSWSDVNDFTVTDLGSLSGLKDISPNTPYTVTISLPSSVSGLDSDITGTISVTVINMNAVVTVQFENEAGTILEGYTLTAGEEDTNSIVTPIYVGDSIDLTSTTYAKVQTQLSALETAGYEIVSRPTDETALKITDTTQTVTYTVKGLLFLQSAPTSVDFGSLTYNAKTQRVDNPTTSGKLIITDTRASKTNGWILYAAVTTEMKNTSTGSIMSDAIRYVTNDKKEITLSSSNQAVYTSTTGGTTDITSGWGTTSDTAGLKLVADPTKTTVSSVGTYSGVITWTIMAGQP